MPGPLPTPARSIQFQRRPDLRRGDQRGRQPPQGHEHWNVNSIGNKYLYGHTTINAGTVQIAGSGQLSSGTYGGNITNTGTLEYSSMPPNTLSGVISGAGNLLKDTNTSTLSLSGVNTFTGNATISAGTLRISAAGQLGSGNYAGLIADNGTLEYSSSAAQTFSGVISGTGNLLKDTSASRRSASQE